MNPLRELALRWKRRGARPARALRIEPVELPGVRLVLLDGDGREVRAQIAHTGEDAARLVLADDPVTGDEAWTAWEARQA